MAAHSGGVEWTSIIKPILAASYGSHNKNDIIELVKAINKSETQLSCHDDEYGTFYTAFAALAADYISSNVTHLCRSQVGVACQASRILLEFLLSRLQMQSGGEVVHISTALSQKQLLLPIRALCSARSCLPSTDLISLTAIMKNAKLPPHIKTSTPSEKEAAASKEPKRARSDLTTSILEQLTTPLQDFSVSIPAQSIEKTEPTAESSAPAPSTDSSQDVESMFIGKNISSLQTLQAGDVLIEMCLNLPYLVRYIHKFRDAVTKKGFSLPASHSEATLVRHSLPSLVGDLTLAWSALSLPVLEPLTPEKLEKLRAISMACLYCAVTNATAGSLLGISAAVSPKCAPTFTGAGKSGTEDDSGADCHAVTAVERSLAIYSLVARVVASSTRAGGHAAQNHALLGAWTLVAGLQAQLAAASIAPAPAPQDKGKEDRGKSPSKGANRINLMKVQQGFGVLSVALASQALTLASSLLDDLQVEASTDGAAAAPEVDMATLEAGAELTALQRVNALLSAAPLNQLLYYLATVSYRKACTLKRIQKHPTEGDNFTASDSTTYYEDDFSCSDESSNDDAVYSDEDSEPILGLWFEETIAPPEDAATSAADGTDGNARNGADRAGCVVPEKGEPHGYIALATKIFQFMDTRLLSSTCSQVVSYVRAGLTDQQMVILAAVIRDLDRESARTDIGTISVYFGASLGALYSEFSQALTRYAHNLLARNVLSDELRTTLLQHLGVSAWAATCERWPLLVYPRTLAVLAQVLLLKPQPEKETACINIWHRLINTMRDNVCSPPASFEIENEDLNVEHAQLALFLFHSLNLMQKKSVLLAVCSAISQCSEAVGRPMRDTQLLHLSRLLLLLEYLMRHLYDAPAALLEQVQWNLLSATNMVYGDAGSSAARIYCAWPEVEDNYRRCAPQEEPKPRFYGLAPAADLNNQDAPKLDGLACNFILGTPDKLKYSQLLDTLLEVLNVTNQASPRRPDKLSFTGLCAAQYCFTICWRLLLLLPPSTSYLEALVARRTPSVRSALLHALVWAPRAGCKTFSGWMKDCLVKQGMFTQYAETLLKNVASTVGTLRYDVDMAIECVGALVDDGLALLESDRLATKEQLPQLSQLCLLDVVIAKIQAQMTDSSLTADPAATSDTNISVRRLALEASLDSDLTVELLPHVMNAARVVIAASRCCLLHQLNETSDPPNKYSTQELEAFGDILAVSSLRCPSTSELAMALMLLLPTGIRTTLDKWNDTSRSPTLSWSTFSQDVIPAESYILAVINAHVASLSSGPSYSIAPSLKSLLNSLLAFIGDHIPKCSENSLLRVQAAALLHPLSVDARAEHASEQAMRALARLGVGSRDPDEHPRSVARIVIQHTHRLVVGFAADTEVDERVLLECLGFMETLLDTLPGRQALDDYFSERGDLVELLLSVASPRGAASHKYAAKVLAFFNTMFATAEKLEGDPVMDRLCGAMSRLAAVDADRLATWLARVFVAPPGEEGAAQESHRLLRALAAYIGRDSRRMGEDVGVALLQALIPIGSQLLSPANEGAGFTELMGIMATLAEGGSGKGHVYLFTAATHWLEIFTEYLSRPEVLTALETGATATPGQCDMQDAACRLLAYARDVTSALAPPTPTSRATTPPWDSDGTPGADADADWPDDVAHDDEDSASDDSDEDHLCNKLCTFTLTQREFMNQHWYHCHTCKMVDGVGVCTVCARVCHAGHDVTYAKYGNFFCDCGAKEDGTCQALVKRSPMSAVDSGTSGAACSAESAQPSLLRRRTSSPVAPLEAGERDRQRSQQLVKQLERSRELLAAHISGSTTVSSLLSLARRLVPAAEASCRQHSAVGCHRRAQEALRRLHAMSDTRLEHTDQLMVPTLGSQEGAFENVRTNYSGDQGQTIRQLLSAHMIRRVAMCCLSSPHGKRQHLAVSHEKGKITVLQLSALLKQADSSKRKLTLTRLASAPIPFTVLSITGNQWNEDFLAVCGLKDCHVVTFGGNGSVSGDHLVLHPQLETGNFIIRAIWLPGKQTELALVTADFVKIYDLSKDALSPQYFFLLPTGKIRDCTFVCSETEGNYMLLMSSTGYILSQAMDDTSSASCGPFYITNTLDIFHPDIKDGGGSVCGGGVSVYYSHALQLLFFSYAQGRSFVAPMSSPAATALPTVFALNVGRTPVPLKTGVAPGVSGAPQPLCQWSEVPNHPGLVCSVMQTSNNPVILMLKPDTFLVQEIKVVPAKAKIMDMVAIRHPSSNSEHRTTLILLCEDGSLRIYMAAMEHTGYWFSASVQALNTGAYLSKPPRKKKAAKAGKPSGAVTFPVDFFEHCSSMTDVEFGGNDLLQIYNTQQIKHRLNTTGMYVVSTKSTGFNLEISNADANLVMVGLRVLLGAQDAARAPSYMEVLGRTIQTATAARHRWYDIPLSREESLQSDKKLTLTFGPSGDADGVTVVDSVKVYGRTKDAFGWPDETAEEAGGVAGAVQPGAGADGAETQQSQPAQLAPVDRMVSSIVEVLDGCFTLLGEEGDSSHRAAAIEVATSLLTLPTPPAVQAQTKCLLAALHSTPTAYHSYKDAALLAHARRCLTAMFEVTDARDLDAEAFHQLVMTVRAIAVARPANLARLADVEQEHSDHLTGQLMWALWRLHAAHPANMAIAPVCVPGLTHVEATVAAAVDIVHALTRATEGDAAIAAAATDYTELLLCPDQAVSFSAKQAVVRALRPRPRHVARRAAAPPTTFAGGSSEAECEKLLPQQQASQESVDDQQSDVDAVEQMNLLAADNAVGGAQHVSANVLEALLDIPPDADDETMVELAIALSLQDHEGGADLASLQQGLQQHLQIHNLGGRTLQSLEALAASHSMPVQVPEPGHYSDTTASAGGSDDEGSTAATDGSTLRTSPAEQGGSESGGSGVDSIEHNVSGRSSAYGDGAAGAGGAGRHDGAAEQRALHSLRLALLDRLVAHVPSLTKQTGVIVVPFMQVVLVLTSDLDGTQERDKACLDRLLTAVISQLCISQPDTEDVCTRTNAREVQLVMLRLLSILMVRPKPGSKAASDNFSFVATATATALLNAGIIDYCFQLLTTLLQHWWSTSVEDHGAPAGGALLRAHTTAALPDMAPFFMRSYVREHPTDQFENYAQLLTEMALRLPYQVQKLVEGAAALPRAWHRLLCEYMMCEQAAFVRRHVRKLLMHACGSRDKYRRLRDMHALESHMKCVMQRCESGTVSALPYDSLVELVEHVKACAEVASARTGNWQRFCATDRAVLPFLLRAACDLDEAVAAAVLQLLQCAVAPPTKTHAPQPASRKDRDKSEEPADSETQCFEESECAALVALISTQVPPELTARFVRTFLLETNATAVRWQAHALVLAIYKNSDAVEQENLLNLMWGLWPQLPAYGRKAAQFVDLLGYFSLKTSQNPKKLSECMEQAVGVLRAQNEVLAQHPNASLYAQLAQYVELDGYYLESEPCLVCNDPEVPLSSIKLSSIKVDSKFTTTTQIVKLAGSHTISKITLRISDLKRTKMVRTINIYYNNRSVQAVVELKNKPAMWHKAKKVPVSTNQTEVKMEFPLPIVACNLMIEYADFYENMQASSETLQCPRCSASVPANPGVCANCGENVFQCHKCRAINYDEKDPFLCHACGFCKYAKFDYTLSARATCAVDPIENDDDRKKTVASINSLLEKADRVYKQLIGHKPTLETCLVKISEHRLDRALDEPPGAATASQVNRAIQMLAQRYCGECKTSFEELSKIIQRVLACRRELVAYDGRDRAVRASSSSSSASTSAPGAGRCYGCAAAATEHCLTLLRALALAPTSRQLLCAHGLARELLDNNLRRGTAQVQDEVRQLLCLLTRDNAAATDDLNALITDRVALTLRGRAASADLAAAVRHEMALLAALVGKEDSCWEQKLRCVMQLFLMACKESKSPMVMQSIILPCLKILQNLIKPDQPASKKNKDKSLDALATIRPGEGIRVDVTKWLDGDPKHSFRAWRHHMPARTSDTALPVPLDKAAARTRYLQEKYASRWRQRSLRSAVSLRLADAAWLKQVVFNPSSRLARQVACSMLESLCQVPVRKREILDLLTSFLGELGSAGESAAEFLSLYASLVAPAPWKQYLAVRGVLARLAQLLEAEIAELHRLEEATLTSDLAQGYALKMLTELLASFLEQESIRQQYKGRLVGSVLNGYLSLRRLVVQRTRLVDETQEKLLELLEAMTSGTEEETKAFMAVCIETVQKYEREDVRTPVFVFERLCSIIYPEENDVGEFFLTLEKDPQQEDFLQGRMLGNPYSSSEPGLGPRMRDVKNKICADCELVALLEDDNGMELLVNNKIISLDLPVREVFKKVWVAEGGEGDAMRVVYRMRGLLGDATEEFVETLDAKSEQEVNNEEVYKMANVMADCGGLQVMLDRLSALPGVGRARPLLHVLLKLFRLCVKVRRCQEVLARPELGAVTVFLDVLRLCLDGEEGGAGCADQLLDIMETILSMAASQPLEEFLRFSRTLGGAEHVRSLLACATAVRNSPSVLVHLTRVLAALTYGNTDKMELLCRHFESAADFNRFDFEHQPDDEFKLELLCMLTAGIERNAIGNTLKDHLISLGMVRSALDYITMHAPCVKPTLLRTDSDEWKEFVSKPALKYVLRFLTGLATEHESTQLLVSEDCIPVIHRLEQVSSNEHVGSLAENLLEALRANPRVASRISEVREQTRAEKKRLAMAMREKQLGALGMRTNDKGQVTAKSAPLMEDLGDEAGLVCVICREGYRFQPSKVLGIYTFTKRANLDEFECRPRKSVGYNTVTHFNVVHVDCHMAAVRLARARDEWESAALQNANTRCNGLLPLWGPQVAESSFASCLARHNTYLQECTSHRDIGYSSTLHDLKLLLLRFAQEKSFHEDTGGGGPQSNIHLIPYVLHTALYVVNSTRSAAREDKALAAYLECVATDKWLDLCYEADGPLYWATVALVCHSAARWQRTRHLHLRRLVVLAHTRAVHPGGPPPSHRLGDVAVKEYSVYKPYLVFFGLIDAIYNCFFKKVVVPTEDQWPTALADYIRHNDEAMLKASERLLATYREELLPCADFEEFCDVTGMLSEINSDPARYMAEIFEGLT